MYFPKTATNAIVIEYQQLKKLGLPSFPKMEEELAQFEKDSGMLAPLNTIAYAMKTNTVEEKDQPIVDTIYKVIDEFKNAYGLDLELNFHDSEYTGSSNDDIDGYFFELDFNQVYKRSVLADTLLEVADFETMWFTFTED